jgi:hypothetical protein
MPEASSPTSTVEISLRGSHSFRRVSISDLPEVVEKIWHLTATHGIPTQILIDFPENRGMLTPPHSRGGPSAILYVWVRDQDEARARTILKENQLID